MKKIFSCSYLLTLTLFLILISCAKKDENGFYKGYEIPSYLVIQKSENIEVRQYKEILVAEVEVEGDRKVAAKEGFITLAGYIFGKNIAREKVAMTSPVNQQEVKQAEEKSQKIAMTSPVSQIKQKGKKWLVQFGMPKSFTLETLPQPKDQRIHFKQIPKKKMVAIVFSGGWSDKRFKENKEKLKKFIEDKSFKARGEAILAYYDDPFTFPWNRRNEVIWEVE